MRYWVYINDKVEGPFEEDKLVTLEGFTPDTLICTETTEAGANQEWVKASTVFEFDPLESTITRSLPTPEELNTAVTPAGTTDPNLTQALKEAHSVSQNAAEQPSLPSQDTAMLILAKLDSITQEIEGLKQKMEEVITAASNQPAYFGQPQNTPMDAIPAPALDTGANTITLTNRDMSIHNQQPMDDSAATTESLVSQAESLVAQANQPEHKNDDFLHGIELDSSADTPSEPPAEMPLGGHGEEEVVLRSALDSLYGAKLAEEQSEKEKEATFQDLLRPRKLDAVAEPALMPEQPVAPAEAQEQKEEILQQFAPAEHKDFIAEALAEAEKEEQAKKEQPAPVEQAAEQQPAHLEGLTPVTPEQEAAIKTDLPEPTANEVPVLSIAPEEMAPVQQAQEEPAPAPQADLPQVEPAPVQEEPQQRDMGEEVPLKTVSAVIPGIEGLGESKEAAQPEPEEEKAPTVQELVPGATLQEKKNDSLISEEDLKNAHEDVAQAEEAAQFDASHAVSSSPSASQDNGPEVMPSLEDKEKLDNQAPQAQEPVEEEPEEIVAAHNQPEEQEAEKTTTQAEYTPNDLTEIELKEGSTYLISDFVPPAQASDFAAAAQSAMEKSKASLNQAAKDAKEAEELEIEEVVPNTQNTKAQEVPAVQAPVAGADVTVSQIILENTIKTKRGAALDIKTVPMVQDPADSQRLDLSDTELQDVTLQHDLKTADLTPAPKKAKAAVMAIMLVVLIGAIYAGVAYLQLIPDNLNFINPKPAVAEQQPAAQMEEMLPTTQPMQPVAPQVSPTDAALTEVKNYALPNGMTLEQLILARHPNAQNNIEWSISSAVDPDNYSVMAKVPPENPQSFKISYRFNYNTVTKALEPTISDSKNLLMSVGVGAAPVQNIQPQAAAMAQQQNAANPRMVQQQAARRAMPAGQAAQQPVRQMPAR